MITDKDKDERYVSSACCTWHGSIHEVKGFGGKAQFNGRSVDVNLPGCPHCGSPLTEQKNRAEWDATLARFAAGHPELPLYVQWMETLHAPCRPLKGWDWRADYAAFAAKAGV